MRGPWSARGGRRHAEPGGVRSRTDDAASGAGLKRGVAFVALVGVLGAGAVGAGAWYWHVRNANDTRVHARAAADQISADMDRALLQYGAVVSGSAALFHQGGVTRAQYADYMEAVGLGSSRFGGLQGVGLVQRVAPDQLTGFLASLRADGIAASVTPAGQRAQYCLGSYAAWSNLRATVPLYGYDVCTVPAIAQALAAATATGRQQVLLGTSLGSAFASDFLLVAPVYAGSPTSASQRAQEVTGWIVAIDNGPALVKSVPSEPGVDFAVYSATAGMRGAQPVLRSPTSLAVAGPWSYTTHIEAYGPWTVRFRVTPGFPQSDGGVIPPVVLLTGGLVAVGLLVALLVSMLTGRRRAEREVTRATRSLQASRQWFRKLVASSSDVMVVVDGKGAVVYTNPGAQRIFGPPERDRPSPTVFAFIHPDDRERATATFAGIVSEPGVHPPCTFRVSSASGEWRVLEIVATNSLEDPAIGGVVFNARDVTEHTHLTRALRTLGQGNRVLVHATDEVTLLRDTCRAVVEAGGYLLAWVGYAEHDEDRTVVPVASAGRSEYLEDVQVTWGEEETGQGPAGRAIRAGAVQVVSDTQSSPRFGPWRSEATNYGFRTVCSLPLGVAGERIGALTIYAGETGAFGRAEVELLNQLADALAYGIGRLRDACSLQDSEQRFRSLAVAAPIGILEVGTTADVRYANPKMAEITGRPIEALSGRAWIDVMHPDDVSELLVLVDRVRPTRERVRAKCRIVRPDGELRHLRLSAAPKGQEIDSGYVVAVEDVTDEVRVQDELTFQAFHDTLTGLPNRALFLDRLNQELSWRGRRARNIAVLFLDLDRFKLVNDSLGHDTGDAVLKEVGTRFSRAIRAGETAARLSGDEFLFIVRGVRGVGDAIGAAQRLRGVLDRPIRYGERDLVVTASVGIVIPGPAASAQSALRDADTAMSEAKAAGRNRYEVFDEQLHDRSVTRLAMENDLRRALARHEFEIYYQPVVETATGRPVAAEALVRWHHPVRGVVSALDFIAVAEDTGLVVPLGAWVLDASLAQLAAWDARADGPRPHPLAVNISARQLDDPETPAMLRRVLRHHKIDPVRLALEVTESAVMSDSATTRKTLNTFRRLGIRVGVDDFGTGYSSLSYLHTLPVTGVKIDRSFVERLGSRNDSTPVVRAIVDMTHAMGLRVTAEGVSKEHLRRQVAALGCDFAQGMLWSAPLPAEEFAAWWRRASQRSPLLARRAVVPGEVSAPTK